MPFFVTRELLMSDLMLFVQGTKKKHRAKIIEYYVEVATECYDKGNFNSAMAIIGKCRFGVYFTFTN